MTKAMTEVRLKPCPFCGSEDFVLGFHEGHNEMRVKCKRCKTLFTIFDTPENAPFATPSSKRADLNLAGAADRLLTGQMKWRAKIMVKKRKKDNIDLICEELMKYNEEHGTSYSYGEYTALVGMGKIKSKYRNERDIDLLLL